MTHSHAGEPPHLDKRPAEVHPETVHVTSRTVVCDGSGGPLGHPRVWLRIADRQTFCPWCSRAFVLDGDGQDAGH